MSSMRRLAIIALVLSACGGGGSEITAAPALVEPQAQEADAAFALILPAGETVIPAGDGVMPSDTGPGVIAFGKAYDPITLQIAEPLTRFKRTFPVIAWGAHLSRGVQAEFLEWSVAIRSSAGAETIVFAVEEPIDGSDVTILANSGNLARLVDHEPGTYVMRYSYYQEVLAEGTFTLVR